MNGSGPRARGPPCNSIVGSWRLIVVEFQWFDCFSFGVIENHWFRGFKDSTGGRLGERSQTADRDQCLTYWYVRHWFSLSFIDVHWFSFKTQSIWSLQRFHRGGGGAPSDRRRCLTYRYVRTSRILIFMAFHWFSMILNGKLPSDLRNRPSGKTDIIPLLDIPYDTMNSPITKRNEPNNYRREGDSINVSR